MASLCIFQTFARVPRTLGRGWRTPDPSPTRDAAGLPTTTVPKILVEEVTTSDCEEDDVGESTHVFGQQSGPWMCTPHGYAFCIGMTRSPPDNLASERIFPPAAVSFSPCASCCQEKGGEVIKECRPCLQGKGQPRRQRKGKAKTQSKVQGMAHEKGQRNEKSKRQGAPQPQVEGPLQVPGLVTVPLPSGFWSPGTTDEAKDYARKDHSPVDMVTIGSIGHPYSCHDPCKYVHKRRGCKDGADCDHCHLCHWTRYRGCRDCEAP